MSQISIGGAQGVELTIEDIGSGRPIVFLHGFSQSRYAWYHQYRSDLADAFRLIGPDLRGHGESEKPRTGYQNSVTWAGDIHAIMTGLDLTNSIIVGWSYGSLIALDYIANYGTSRIAGLNLIGPVAAIGTEEATKRLGREYIDLVPGFISTDTAESIEAMSSFIDLCVASELPPDEKYFQLGYNVVVPPYVRDQLRSRRVSHESLLESIGIPILISQGEEDAVVLPRATEEYAASTPDCEVSWYPEVGHSPFWERPERFNRELQAFVTRV